MSNISLLNAVKIIMALLLVMIISFAVHDIYSSSQGYEQTLFAEKTKMQRDEIDNLNYNIAIIRGMFNEQALNSAQKNQSMTNGLAISKS
ncbi:hypothetical protein [Yersinia vastinensis]|uniref:hypothetical protein n=1 Tax=Yersinia vastinensis TaxID=2890318 RepID=UPI0005E7C529|nr:hypothetical protein [Yersinia vastinensis]OVZ98640.1 hypothetical protein CBW53_04080 [Yersinia frederiksenii]CNI45091.1 Uncharacterised protein [Yersinia frederiksenii]